MVSDSSNIRVQYDIMAKTVWDKLIRVDYHGLKEVPTGTCQAILKAGGLEEGRGLTK